MGVGNLQQALTAYGKGIVPYAQLYFDSSPLRHAAAWRKLASLGDDSSTYLWRVLAAREIMRPYRDDPRPLQREAVLQAHKASAEEVLHPPSDTPVFGDPVAIGRARTPASCGLIDRTVARPLRADASTRGMGMLAGRIKQSPRLYRALRPQALAVLQALGAATRAISGSQPLIVTSTVRDKDYQRAAGRDRSRGDARLLAAHHGLRLRHRPRVPQPRPGARLPVRARPPGGARDDRLGPRAPGDPRHRRVALGRQRAEQLAGGLRGVLRCDPELLEDEGPGALAPKRSIATTRSTQ